MRLTKLEIQGFKSFADQTDMVFEPGVTAIVGPNGCGKSNVSDAVRWVLGEQRARALRGAKMEEVIFQGSSARRPVNVAEVSLHFENDDGTLDIPFREVVITRRLSRSGESDYFLNGAACRLRDIHDMVRGTGLGADSGVVIESKMIDALLSDRPDDRRELFEEAAGIGLYRDRKRSAERRLEETTTDLSRIDDLISEVQSQVRSLARQRKRAERHSELMGRRFTLEVAHAAREMHAWRGELGQLEERVTALRVSVPAEEEHLRAAESAREALLHERTTAEARRTELSRLVADQRETSQQLRGEIAVAEERLRNATSRRERAEEERREGDVVAGRVSTELERASAEFAQLESALRDAEEALATHARHEEEVRASLSSARSKLEHGEKTLRELREQLHRSELDSQSLERESDELSTRRAALEGERLELSDAAEMARRDLAAAEDAAAIAASRFSETTSAAEAAVSALQSARERDANARAELLKAEELNTALTAKLNALEGLERERVGLAPAAARLLRERGLFEEGAILGPLSDFISADAPSAALVERFLGPTVNAVLVRDRATAEAIRTWHASAAPGPLLLLPVDAPDDVGSNNGDDVHGLSSLVQSSSAASRWVRSLLGRVTSLEAGTAFVDSRGAIWLPANEAGPGPLRRRAEITELKSAAANSAHTLHAASAAASSERSVLAAAERASIEAQEALSFAARANAEASDRTANISRQYQRAEREASEARALMERLTDREAAVIARLQTLFANTQDIAARISEHETGLAAAREMLATAEHKQEDAREQRTASQIRRAQAQAQLEVASDRQRHLSEEFASATGRLESLQVELTTLSSADSQLSQQITQWQSDLAAREATLHDAEQKLSDAEDLVKRVDEQLSSDEHALGEMRRHSSAMSDELHAAELRYTELSGRRAAIRERLEAEWKKPVEELLAGAETLELDDETLRQEAALVREQLEALGPVNPLAIEEHEEETKRLEFLTTQRDDLNSAKNSLQQAIREIDTTARELFLQTFVQVRENFRNIFMTLFGGGECDLRLENPESPLDGDIEIHASPRGKRTQRIHLLSSGEKALVALSLLFGIFLTKPSPFCLLDEVDAPLDDQNIGHFVRMLNRFKSNTQFIVITHNPRTTTEAADAVYGVTMQEPGVSSLVSVRMRGRTVDETITPAHPAHTPHLRDEEPSEAADTASLIA
ncbi:MAG TPA: chromosome segregation protein SMC [Gemmatimonadaceae bacterium]|nr:chromosome segregation protein SMC [Gemmatimonadaceae bacterium]